jgi:uncharacterized damage-inducible protein DinB
VQFWVWKNRKKKMPKKPYYNKKNNNRKYNNRKKNNSIIKKIDQNTHLTRENFIAVKSLKKSTEKIISYVDPCSEAQLLWSLSPEKWNIKEILGHLIQVTELFQKRLAQALENPGSELSDFDGNAMLKEENFPSNSLERLLHKFIIERKNLENLCMRTMNDDWENKVVHSQKGEMSFRDLILYFIEHDETHTNQIFMNLQRNDPWIEKHSHILEQKEEEQEEKN